MRQRHCIPAVVASLFLCATASAGELKRTVTLSTRDVTVKVSYPKDEQAPWAEMVASTCEAGLPALETAFGFSCPVDTFEVAYGEDAGAADGYEARWKGNGRLSVRAKSSMRGAVHGHWILSALAYAWAEKVASEPWVQGALANYFVWRALADAPAIYDARTYRQELIEEGARAADDPLDGWVPGSKADRSIGTANAAPFCQVARGVLFLFCLEQQYGDGAIRKVAETLSAGKPGGTKEIAKAVALGKKPADDWFLGWATPIKDPEKQKAILKTSDIRDPDDDGLVDFEEAALGTDPKSADTDGDGLLDGEEVFDTKTNPKVKDPQKLPVTVDGDPKEWARLKKLAIADKSGDPKGGVRGADLLRAALCADRKYLYLELEVDTTDNAEVKYTFGFDTDDDGNFNYYVGFRGDGSKPWLLDTHNQKSGALWELKNHRAIIVKAGETAAEARLPLATIGDPRRFTVVVISESKAGQLDSCDRTAVDLDKWR